MRRLAPRQPIAVIAIPFLNWRNWIRSSNRGLLEHAPEHPERACQNHARTVCGRSFQCGHFPIPCAYGLPQFSILSLALIMQSIQFRVNGRYQCTEIRQPPPRTHLHRRFAAKPLLPQPRQPIRPGPGALGMLVVYRLFLRDEAYGAQCLKVKGNGDFAYPVLIQGSRQVLQRIGPEHAAGKVTDQADVGGGKEIRSGQF